MMAEAIHSVSRLGNQILVLVGQHQSKGKSEAHAFGQGKLFFGFFCSCCCSIFALEDYFQYMRELQNYGSKRI